MTKNSVFLIGLVGTTAYLFLFVFRDALYDFCFSNGNCLYFWDSLDVIGPFLFFFPFIFLFSLITYRLREEVFRAWLHFAYWWVPLSLVMTYLAAGSSGGGFGIPNVFDQEFAAIILSGLFTLISFILIIWKYFSFRHA